LFINVIASPPDNKTPLPLLTPARANRLLSGAILPDVIKDLMLIKQGKSFASAAEIYYDYAECNAV